MSESVKRKPLIPAKVGIQDQLIAWTPLVSGVSGWKESDHD